MADDRKITIQIDESIKNSISPAQTLDELNQLPNGSYYAKEAGDYAFGVTVEDNQMIIFNKKGSDWVVLSKVEFPSNEIDVKQNYDSTSTDAISGAGVAEALKGVKGLVVDTEFSITSSNSIANKTVTSKFNEITTGISNVVIDISKGYWHKTTKVFTANTSWNTSQLIPITSLEQFQRTGSAIATSSNVYEVTAFNSNKEVIGGIQRNSTSYKFTLADLPTDTVYFCISSTTEMTLIKYFQFPSSLINGLEKINDLNKLVNEVDGFENGTNGYVSNVGVESDGVNWTQTPFIAVNVGDKLIYSGQTNNSASAVYGYDENQSPILNLLTYGAYTKKEVVITDSRVKFIKASAIRAGVPAFSLIYSQFNQNEVNYNDGLKEYTNEFFIPSKVYGISGQPLSLNLNGVVNKHPLDYSRDTYFNHSLGNEDFIVFTPTANDVVPVSQRILTGERVILGNIPIKVKTTTIVNPTEKQFFIHLGDSTVQGKSSANIEGCIVNELSRMLNGVGTPALDTSLSPTALNLDNMQFIGTLGDQPIKHEGRGGWNYQDYLQRATKESVPNAFWNPETSQFDIDYYLQQNNFTEVNADGSNLTILIQLGWNDVFNFTPTQIEVYCKQLIDVIKSKKQNIRVKLLSMNLPPYDVYKAYNGTREQSYVSTMKKVITVARLYEKIALEDGYNSFVEHVPYMPTFFPVNSYPSLNIKANKRSADLKKVYNDDVHPTAQGYAQMADTLFNCLIYNYC